jgi:hypothetical protein
MSNRPVYKMKHEQRGQKKEKEKMNSEQRRVVLDALTNDESSTDQELKEYFKKELGLTGKEASYWVSKRSEYLGRI